MSTIILYKSKYGTTKDCAKRIASGLDHSSTVKDISEVSDISEYDIIVIGSPTYAGNMNKDVKNFCKNNLDVLLTKKIAIFTCGSLIDKYMDVVKACIPESLIHNAKVIDCFGGELQTDKMNFLEKKIVGMIGKTGQTPTSVQQDRIDAFVDIINKL